ncbi:sugar ABC transporter [Fusobacterium ulcerans]|uniref:D-xylose-binding periplasmic protein n=1 Tax=Fusobacterium ulcerans TaxID=861 RepID=A0AAX2J7U7_9FUSO|nr:substrate-binding domain-containing protein [Fusobacterium ulcerans]AVQ28474.1 sugar ABC transporter [Fusobacterium ulcerans]EFS25941.1 hypothetical protein FUAG_01456 [Fusobacterium ulcerans ATCC 49185]SQJ00313.1 D-xylose-binding periplasmic protein precursor [Fusobacterium ulcerans]
MLKKILLYLGVMIFFISMIGCKQANKNKGKIGVSFGVGEAIRWKQEKEYMQNRADELGIKIEIKLNTKDKPKTQEEDCFELIDSEIDVLIITPRNVNDMSKIIKYAEKKKVKVISYARIILKEKVDLYVGYDSKRMGQMLGQYLAEKVYKGNYILLKGDENDENANLLYEGALRYIEPIKNDINVILDTSISNWSPKVAKELVTSAIKANNNKIDAILAPNDKIAEGCVEAIEELNINRNITITGMDAELSAVKRILNEKQDVTIYMDLKELAYTAIDEAFSMIHNKPISTNAEYDNQSGKKIPSHLITGRLVTKQNIDRILIESKVFTREEIYNE